MRHRIFWQWSIFMVLLATLTIAGLELLSSLVVPNWPARDLRPVEATNLASLGVVTGAQVLPHYNSWGLNDRERFLQKPKEISYRAVMVGDSFLEGVYVSKSLGARIEDLWQAEGHRDREVISLGISATAPPQYYYRISNVALSLQPNAIVLVFFSGNDFVSNALSAASVPPPIAERPLPSWLGFVAPRLTWLVVNRLGWSEFGRSTVKGADVVGGIVKLPREERLDAMVEFAKSRYPEKDEKAIREVLSRVGDKFWNTFEPRDRDEEYLQAWWIAGMVDWETGTWPTQLTKEEAERAVQPEEIDATASWLIGARDLAQQRGVKFMVALAPVPIIDPVYFEFWSPWPRYRSYQLRREATHRALRKVLEAKGVPTVDLQDDFEGVRATYRVSDGHWTEYGTEIAAKRISAELLKLK